MEEEYFTEARGMLGPDFPEELTSESNLDLIQTLVWINKPNKVKWWGKTFQESEGHVQRLREEWQEHTGQRGRTCWQGGRGESQAGRSQITRNLADHAKKFRFCPYSDGKSLKNVKQESVTNHLYFWKIILAAISRGFIEKGPEGGKLESKKQLG